MKSLQLLHLCKKLSAITLSRGFRTDGVLSARGRGNVPRRIPYEPGVRHRGAVLEDVEIGEEIESDELEDVLDVMNVENVYDTNTREIKRRRAHIGHQITAKKFFSSPPQPPMLTWNERECIKYLHKQDPVQWDFKTLSESFPATPDTVKKIVRNKRKITPEMAKKLDSVVQRNWELLAEGKLEAEPHVLKHMKKFVNRREVLLEQIKNVKFYLPEVKKEHVWNKGEFTGILSKYERQIEKIMKQLEMEQKPKMITDNAVKEDKGEGEMEVKGEEKNILDVIHERIQQTASRPELAKKDSFMFGGVTNFYSKLTTLEDLKKQILRRAKSNKKLGLLDKAILQDTLDCEGDKLKIDSGNFSKNESYDAKKEIMESSKQKLSEIENDNLSKNEEGTLLITSENFSKNAYWHKRNEKMKESSGQKHSKQGNSSDNQRMKREERIKEKMEFPRNHIIPDERTHLADETSIGKLFCNFLEKPQSEEESNEEEFTEESDEYKIDFSNPVRLERENKHYDQEVKDIENTEFWNTRRTSKHKALIEIQKPPLDGPKDISKGINFAKTVIFSPDSYPERINIPMNKRGSGLTFKVKDCYYDDDGKFLYRVPGMTN